jgi:GET complex subunit GET2
MYSQLTPRMSIDPPLPNITPNFLGEDSIRAPNRNSVSPSPSPSPNRRTTPSRNADIFEGLGTAPPDPSVWLPEQRQQFTQALMNASSSPLPASSPIGEPSMPVDPSLPPIDNPFAALLAAQAGGGSGGGVFPPFGPGMTGKAPLANDVPEPTKLQKAMPLLHILAMWCLLAYFVFWAEPHMHSAVNGEDDGSTVGLWRRWAELGRHSPLLVNVTQALKVQFMVRFFLPCVHVL